MRYSASELRKFIVAAAGFAVTVLTTILAVGPDLIPAAALPYINVVIAVAASYGVFAVRNAPTAAPRHAALSKGDLDPELDVQSVDDDDDDEFGTYGGYTSGHKVAGEAE